MIVCTSLCANYLAKASVLAASLRQHARGVHAVFCLVERSLPPEAAALPGVSAWLLPEDLGLKNPGRFLAGRTPLEGATAVKAHLLTRLLARFPRDRHFLYLDPDVEVLSGLDDVVRRLERHPILLTPHLLVPNNPEMERSALSHGAFNLGFLALARSVETTRFLAWWRERLARECWDDRPNGLFTDQKWLDLAPGYFDVGVVRDPGYNVATWTLKERDLTRRGKRLLAGGRPVRFLHYSGFDQGTFTWAAKRWAGADRALLLDLAAGYAAKLKAAGQEGWASREWSYARLNDGRKLPGSLRTAFRREDYLPGVDPYPLTLSALRRALPREERVPARWTRFLRCVRRAFLRDLLSR